MALIYLTNYRDKNEADGPQQLVPQTRSVFALELKVEVLPPLIFFSASPFKEE
jgi:hypothetical protein